MNNPKLRLNWRDYTIVALAFVALCLFMAESDNLHAFIAIKALGFIVGLAVYLLGRHWSGKLSCNLSQRIED